MVVVMEKINRLCFFYSLPVLTSTFVVTRLGAATAMTVIEKTGVHIEILLLQ